MTHEEFVNNTEQQPEAEGREKSPDEAAIYIAPRDTAHMLFTVLEEKSSQEKRSEDDDIEVAHVWAALQTEMEGIFPTLETEPAEIWRDQYQERGVTEEVLGIDTRVRKLAGKAIALARVSAHPDAVPLSHVTREAFNRLSTLFSTAGSQIDRWVAVRRHEDE
jgi:hypothetical protein